ncbi:MAG: hypothetical protein J6U01_05795 [Clostridia bacterium]|nr:hypothetical protein [Clostridia bacterium]
MKAVEFFGKINEAERRLCAAERKVALFQSLAEGGPLSLDGERVSHSRNVHANEDAVIRLSEAKDSVRKLKETYCSLVDRIMDRMVRLEDPEDEKLLSYHYLEHAPLTSVADRMHRGKTWVYQRHALALERLDSLLQDL